MLLYCFVIHRYDAAQRVNDVLVCLKKNVQRSPECVTAVAKIVVQLLLHTDDSIKVTKLVVQVHVTVYGTITVCIIMITANNSPSCS